MKNPDSTNQTREELQRKVLAQRRGFLKGALLGTAYVAPVALSFAAADLARAIERDADAAAAWQELRPSAKREHVKAVVDAKKPETRERRIQKIVAALSGRG